MSALLHLHGQNRARRGHEAEGDGSFREMARSQANHLLSDVVLKPQTPVALSTCFSFLSALSTLLLLFRVNTTFHGVKSVSNTAVSYTKSKPVPVFLRHRLDNTVKSGSRMVSRSVVSDCKLSHDGIKYDGHGTMQAYISDQAIRGYTWFSTQALYYGMSPKRVESYNKAINRGEKVKILFGIGVSAGGKNDIAYSADVKEIYSSTEPVGLPTNDYPTIWHGEKARIWLKIENLQPETQLTAKLFQITSSGTDLQQVINNSQYHFGYVSYK